METDQITLTDTESKALRAIAQQTGKTKDELIREAVEQLIAQFHHSDRRAQLVQARGIWKDRNDLPALDTLRNEWDRFQP
jgi:hypothetical protein